MSRPRDAADRLRDANPVPLDEAPSSNSPRARALFERIVDTPTEVQHGRTRALKGRALILVPIAALAVAAATYGLFRAVDQPLVAACYQRASLNAPRAIVPATDQGAVAACGALWRSGAPFNADGRASVPPLAACVLDSGEVGVFPDVLGSDTCSALGLAHPSTGGGGQEQRRILELKNAVAARFLGSCVGREPAVALVQTELQRYGLRDWRVVSPMPFTLREPCASAAYDLGHRTITLVPVSDTTAP
jgi:hypothetical protein